MDKFAIILAGGVGYNFWPRSREKRPKQLLKFFNNKSLLQLTVERIKNLFPPENIYIVSNRVQKMAIKDQLPEIPSVNILDEPFGKKTAASIALATAAIRKKNENAITVVLPSDHIINDIENYQESLVTAISHAEQNYSLVTIGIPPAFPAIDYGYIQFDEAEIHNIHNVLTFAEKPTQGTANRFVESGDFLWNSGIFIWQTDVILSEMKKFMPDLYHAYEEILPAIGEPEFDSVLTAVYSKLKGISIDYGIMEHSEEVSVVEGRFDWKDIDKLEDLLFFSHSDSNNNFTEGDIYLDNVKNSYIYSPSKFAAILGVDNIVVIETNDALLVCDRDNADHVLYIIDNLRLNDKKHLL